MCNLYTYKLLRDEVRGLLEHYKLAGRQWSDVFDKEMRGRRGQHRRRDASQFSPLTTPARHPCAKKRTRKGL